MWKAFTLIEVLVSMAIVALLAGILVPTLSQVREKGRQIHCTSNLRQIGMAMRMYADDHDGFWVPSSAPNPFGGTDLYWSDILRSHLRSGDILRCMDDPSRGVRSSSYAWSYPHLPYRWPTAARAAPAETSLDAFSVDTFYRNPSQVFILTDAESPEAWPDRYVFQEFVYCPVSERRSHIPGGGRKGASPFGNIVARHLEGAMYLFLDGRVQWVRREQVVSIDGVVRTAWGHDPL